jgi:hypothetical protein
MSAADPSIPLTVDEFRLLCPEFKDPVQYPDETIAFWLSICPIDYETWGPMYNFGQAMFVAHELKKFGAADGQPPGLAAGGSGIVSSKSVGPVSVSYDTALGSEEDAGMWNGSWYGRQFIHFARLMGMGPIQVGAVSPHPFGAGAQSAWRGPPPFPGWFG